jgi:hypothetical protein
LTALRTTNSEFVSADTAELLESMAAPFVFGPPERPELMKMANSRRARSEDGRRLSLRAISAGAFTRITEPYRAMAACDSERR